MREKEKGRDRTLKIKNIMARARLRVTRMDGARKWLGRFALSYN